MSERRFFSQAEKLLLLKRAQNQCEICSTSIDRFHSHVHHRLAHTKGGPTSLENAMILCADCNLTIGKGLTPWIAPLRAWQNIAYEKWQQKYFGEHRRDFTISAFPGSGKTKFALRVAHHWLSNMPNPFVIFVVPSDWLKVQMAGDAQQVGVALTKEFKKGQGYRADADGIVITYNALAYSETELDTLCKTHNVMVFMDECHHIAGDNLQGQHHAWGSQVQGAFRHAQARMLMTGTLWRSDSHAIPYVEYDGNNTAKADYEFTYADALTATISGSDLIAREFMFSMNGGDAKFWYGLDEYDIEINEDLDYEMVSPALRTITNPTQGKYFEEAFAEADSTLLGKINDEDYPYPSTAGLLIVPETSLFPAYAEIVRKVSGTQPIEVNYKMENVRDTIVNFRDKPRGKPRWIMSVNMISEGTDIPRLSVLVYSTIIRKRLYVHQALGRVVRWDHNGPVFQQAHVFFPNMQPYVKYAEEIKTSRNHVLTLAGSSSEGPMELDSKLYTAIDSSLDLGQTIYDEQKYGKEWLELADWVKTQRPAFRRYDRQDLAIILKTGNDVGANPNGQPFRGGTSQLDIDQRAYELGNRVQRYLSDLRLKYFREADNIKPIYSILNGHLNQNYAGGRKRREWKETDFMAAFEVLEEWRRDGLPLTLMNDIRRKLR